MKSVTFVVEITCEINDNVDPEDVTFNIDLPALKPVGYSNNPVGKATGYSTVNHFVDFDNIIAD